MCLVQLLERWHVYMMQVLLSVSVIADSGQHCRIIIAYGIYLGIYFGLHPAIMHQNASFQHQNPTNYSLLQNVLWYCLYSFICTRFSKLILGKFIKTVAKRRQILRPKCTKFDVESGNMRLQTRRASSGFEGILIYKNIRRNSRADEMFDNIFLNNSRENRCDRYRSVIIQWASSSWVGFNVPPNTL